MEIALNLAAAIGLMVALLAVIIFGFFARDLAGELAVSMLKAGGQRKEHCRAVRGIAIFAFLTGLACLMFSIPRGHEVPGAHHVQLILALAAFGLFCISAILFAIWWRLAGEKLDRDPLNANTP